MNHIIEIGVVVLLIVGIALCTIALIVLLRLAPPAIRSMRNLEKISLDIGAVAGGVATDVATTAHNAVAASESAVAASKDLATTAGALAAVSEEVSGDVATTARNAAAASENVVAASRDVATAANSLAAVGQLNVPVILGQVASGQIGNIRQLAGFIGSNWPAAASRAAAFFRRG